VAHRDGSPTLSQAAKGIYPICHIPIVMQPGLKMTDDLDTRRRRASYRAHHRGTKEMDVLVGRYADARLIAFSLDDLARFERFLAIPDPTLQAWIFAGRGFDGLEFESLVLDIRAFHGLAEGTE
jgi:antitoxin CptB